MTKSNGKATDSFPGFQAFTAFQPEAMTKSVEQFYALFGEFSELNRSGLTAFNESAKAATKGFEEMGTRAANYMKTSMEAGMAASKSISGAKTVHELVELQTDFAKLSLEAYMEEASAVASLVAGTVREVAEPLNNHAGVVVEKLQDAG